ncbi:MAG TPA: hypothetical protein VMJ35_02000 [Dongiaceae bacterium]|nr:hypothetical protein [Dongiaceae bacterium]
MEQLVGGRQLQYEGVHCALTLEQCSPRVVLLKISGTDIGEFGEAPMATLSEWLENSLPIHFFIDARAVRGASIDVSGDWAKWLGRNRAKLHSVTMLTGSRFINLTAEFVRRFSELQGIMRICTEPGVFDGALNDAVHRA